MSDSGTNVIVTQGPIKGGSGGPHLKPSLAVYMPLHSMPDSAPGSIHFTQLEDLRFGLPADAEPAHATLYVFCGDIEDFITANTATELYSGDVQLVSAEDGLYQISADQAAAADPYVQPGNTVALQVVRGFGDGTIDVRAVAHHQHHHHHAAKKAV